MTATGQQTLREEWWTAEDCSRYLGISANTWRDYWQKGKPRGNPAPEPDRYFGVTPVWSPPRVRQWHETRPGRGWWRTQGHGRD